MEAGAAVDFDGERDSFDALNGACLDAGQHLGTREMSGSDAIRFRKCVIAAGPSSRPSSMLTSMI